MEPTRFLISLRLARPVSRPLVVIVVPRQWSCFAVRSALAHQRQWPLGFRAFAVGDTLSLFFELSQPFMGVFRLPTW